MKSGWTRLVRMAAAMLALAAGVWAQGAGAAEVKNVTAEYVWPWGVGISYEVSGTVASSDPFLLTATDRASGATYVAAANALSGDTGPNTGAHRVVWDVDKQGVRLQSTNVVFTVMYEPLYCVVDLSAGANASSYPVTYMDAPPSGGFNTDTYKTTKLVLRRIWAGTFTMGSPSGETYRGSDETQHKVTLTKPLYIGMFEVTQKQYQLVTGNNPSERQGDKWPVETVSWNTIRGNSGWPASSAVSADSFMGRLRARTGLDFDLPTEAQWEYACRAGTTTAYSCGEYEDQDYMWSLLNSYNATREVGTKKPNPWGLYDIHGNVYEWCLDWYASNLGTAAVIDPKGASSGSDRVLRGGCVGRNVIDNYGWCRSANRDNMSPTGTSRLCGFRLSLTLSK